MEALLKRVRFKRVSQYRFLLNQWPVTQLRPEVDFTQYLGPPILKDSWKWEAQPSTSAPRPLATKKSHSTSLNPLDHSFKPQRKPSDAESGDVLPSDDDDPPFECAMRKLSLHTPGYSDDETNKDDGDTGVDPGTRLYGKSADIHLVGPTVFWKYKHIMEVTPPAPRPETQPSDPVSFPKVRRPIYWGSPFSVSDCRLFFCTSIRTHLFPINSQVGTRMGRRPSDKSWSFSLRSGQLSSPRPRRKPDRPLFYSCKRGIPSVPPAYLLRPLEGASTVS